MAANKNRSVRVLTLGENWREFARMKPEGMDGLGTVQRAGSIHAFGRDQSGQYWIFGDGRPEQLPTEKIERAIASIKTGMKG